VSELTNLQSPTGLRERKKLATRDALVRAAIELFEVHGVDATTVDDIADAVGVSPRTFHRYFASKEAVLFAGSEERHERFRAALENRPVDEPLLDSLRVVVHDMTSRIVKQAELERRRQHLLRTESTLSAIRLAMTAQWQQTLADHAARRLRIHPNEPLAVLIGACTSATMRTALDHWLDSPTPDCSAVVDQCFDLLADLDTATSRSRNSRNGRDR
jgi:AcrR family transcriptional regulator